MNAEKKMEEWKAEEEERKMEKMAEDYLKKMEKKGKGGKKDDGAEKYVEKYREESRRCVEEVERSVRESMGELLGAGKKKRKLIGGVSDAKKLKIWKGKRKMGESDSDDSDGDTESDGSDAEHEKSVVTDNGNQSDSSKDASSASVTVLSLDGDNPSGGSSDSGSEEEKEMAAGGVTGVSATASGSNGVVNGDVPMEMSSGPEMSASVEVASTSAKIEDEQDPNEPHSRVTTATDQLSVASTSVELDGPQTVVPELPGASESKAISPDEGTIGSSNASDVLSPVNLDDFNSASELEVLGMERLKSELQAHGLKCGGTLQERAARLFLLKTTPLEKLPKKLLAKK